MRASYNDPAYRLIHETLLFTQHALHASGSVFYWVEGGVRMVIAQSHEMPVGLLDRYEAEMNEFDPMQVRRMVAAGQRVGVLNDARTLWPVKQMSRYRTFLTDYDVTDTIDLLLWDDRSAFAGIGVVKRRGDPPLAPAQISLDALQRYLETSLRAHPRVRTSSIEAALDKDFHLTRREREVATLMATGASNSQIADAMGIRLATVKTYAISIFDKFGVASRTALMARLAHLPM